jgi:hypothetical protein
MRNSTVALAVNSFLGGLRTTAPEIQAAGRWARGEEDVPVKATRRCKVGLIADLNCLHSTIAIACSPYSHNFW